MSQVVLEIPEDAAAVMKVPKERVADEMRMLAAVKLLEMGRISTGRAAQFAGISKPEFLQRMGAYGVPAFDLTEEELRRDIENA